MHRGRRKQNRASGARSSKFFECTRCTRDDAVRKGQDKGHGGEHSPTLFAPLGAILKTGAGSGVRENNGRTRWRRFRYLEMANRECALSRRLGKLASKEHKFFTMAEDRRARFTGGRFADIWRPKFQSCRPLFFLFFFAPVQRRIRVELLIRRFSKRRNETRKIILERKVQMKKKIIYTLSCIVLTIQR